jgi:thioredoxin 1
MQMLHVNDNNFQAQVISSKEPILVDFWAQWCGPCKRVSPIVEELCKEYEGKVKIAKANVDEAREVASRFGIMSIPTFMLFKDGKIVRQMVGAVSKNELRAMIDGNI